MNWISVVFHITEIVGTISFAASGSMTAIRKRLDLFGVIFIGGITALGGGTIRDMLLGYLPPRMFNSFEFLLLSAITSLLIFLIAYFSRNLYQAEENRIEQYNSILDAIGLAAFVVTGTQAAITAGHADNMFLCVFLGVTTGIGGGILRDLMCQEVPAVLRKHIYAVAAIAGGILYCVLLRIGISTAPATIFSMVLTFTIRMLARHYRWSLPRIPY